MDRRAFLGALGLLAAPLALEAQQAVKTARIGFLSFASAPTPPTMDISSGLRELGWIEGKNLAVEYRWASNREDQLPVLAAELARLKVDVIVTSTTLAAMAAKRATSTIPIVITFVADPVGSGLVASLARPGGNITGVSTLGGGLVAKRLELLKAVVPRATHVAVLTQRAYSGNVRCERWSTKPRAPAARSACSCSSSRSVGPTISSTHLLR